MSTLSFRYNKESTFEGPFTPSEGERENFLWCLLIFLWSFSASSLIFFAFAWCKWDLYVYKRLILHFWNLLWLCCRRGYAMKYIMFKLCMLWKKQRQVIDFWNYRTLSTFSVIVFVCVPASTLVAFRWEVTDDVLFSSFFWYFRVFSSRLVYSILNFVRLSLRFFMWRLSPLDEMFAAVFKRYSAFVRFSFSTASSLLRLCIYPSKVQVLRNDLLKKSTV